MAIFQYPFAKDGDRNTDLPNGASLTGLVSFQEGFTPIYETLPSLGGQYIRRRDFNEIVYRICAGVNTLDGQGNKILADLTTAIGEFKLGQTFYCPANENIYLLVDNASITEESTLGDLVSAGKVKNITPLGQGQTWQNMAASRALGVTYTNTTGRAIALSVSTLTRGEGRCGIIINGGIINKGVFAPGPNVNTSNAAIIPNGATYSAVLTGELVDVPGALLWYELR